MLYLEASYRWHSSGVSVGICPVLHLYQSPEGGDGVHLPRFRIQHQVGRPVVKYLRAGLHDLGRREEGDDSDPMKFNKDER